MKRIEFIAPVESMRGNLGSKQNLVYAPNNNRAFDSIEGQKNPALNYESRFIGAKGKRNYFCVKTKSSVNLTQNSKTAMADFGGIGAVYAAIVRDKSSMTYIKINGIYQKGVDEGHIHMSFRKYLSRYIGYMLKNKLDHYTFTDGVISASIDNPWVKKGVINIPVPSSIVIKFWNQLASNPMVFYVNGQKGLAHVGDKWGDVINGGYNVLNLSLESPDSNYVMYNGKYVKDDEGDDVDAQFAIITNGIYHT